MPWALHCPVGTTLCRGHYTTLWALCHGHYTTPWALHTVGCSSSLRMILKALWGQHELSAPVLPSQAQAHSPLCLGHRPLPVPHSPVSCHWLRAISEDEPKAHYERLKVSPPYRPPNVLSLRPQTGAVSPGTNVEDTLFVREGLSQQPDTPAASGSTEARLSSLLSPLQGLRAALTWNSDDNGSNWWERALMLLF